MNVGPCRPGEIELNYWCRERETRSFLCHTFTYMYVHGGIHDDGLASELHFAEQIYFISSLYTKYLHSTSVLYSLFTLICSPWIVNPCVCH